MVEYRSEEEQVELLKSWWKSNGLSTVAGVLIALLAYFAWNGWKSHQQSEQEAASALYQDMIAARDERDEKNQNANSDKLAEQLRTDYSSSVYALFATLHLAKEAVEKNDLPRANELLIWAQAHKPDASLAPLVALRLAQVQFAMGENDKAKSTLAAIKGASAYDSAYAELRGDIALAQGKTQEARSAYLSAQMALDASGVGGERRRVLDMKLAELAPATVFEPVKAAAAIEKKS